ncbi:MAG TPA: DUF6259 domain-containing protein, partial [Phycisphaerae bacterium]|nr:DUF6259 domain-containing protein [Phycisphaerae bacterium]
FDRPQPGTITPRVLSDTRAEVRFHGWDGDGVLAITECPATGELVVEPSACSSRAGILACRWNLPGLGDDLKLVAPLFQGVRLELPDELIRGRRWRWPFQWEAALAILEGQGGGFWVHAQDTRYRYKALNVGCNGRAGLAFDTEAYGPLDASLAAGGLPWRINVFEGDWRVPAGQYRDWLRRACGFDRRRERRPEWLDGLRLAIGWCGGDLDLLDALAERIEPRKVLIHFSNWRTDGYDQNYPTYTASDAGRAFIQKGSEMGFHVMPHCNSIDMDPTHPVYPFVRDYQYREPIHHQRQGWAWDMRRGVSMTVPNSNASLLEHRDEKVMVKIHPGLGLWRSILCDSVQTGLADLTTGVVFLDVTLCTWNLHNCLVEDQTPTEGMLRLIDEVAEMTTPAAPEGLAVGGEGMNETIAPGLCIGQVHLFNSSGPSTPGLARAAGCPLNAFLFEGLVRTFGYSKLSGRDADEILRSDIHLSLGALPTITHPTAEDIRRPNEYVRKLLERL